MTTLLGPTPDVNGFAPALAPDSAATQFYLHPGGLYFGTEATVITTILGPCVAICMFDEQSGAAGMNHYLVPNKLVAESPRYAEVANAMLVARFTKAGIPVRALKAKVFGGAAMRSVKSDLAERNIHAAFDFLETQGIPVVGSNVGGDRGRKLHFRTTDGAAWVRFL